MIDFFLNRLPAIDPIAEEVSCSLGSIEEQLYNRRTLPPDYLMALKGLRARYFPDIALERIECFSVQRADGLVYQEPKVMVLVNNAPRDIYLYPEHKVYRPHPDYCVNVLLDSGQRKTKFYDLDYDFTQLPLLPKGAVVAPDYGAGVNRSANLVDVYFLYNDYAHYLKHFGVTDFVPNIPELRDVLDNPQLQKMFGIAFDATTLDVVKHKYYYYPSDPLNRYSTYDETLEPRRINEP